jgi:uncharacterized protein with PQ loop repeat
MLPSVWAFAHRTLNAMLILLPQYIYVIYAVALDIWPLYGIVTTFSTLTSEAFGAKWDTMAGPAIICHITNITSLISEIDL